MGKKFKGQLIISLIIVFLLILPALSHAQQKQRVKVVVRNASVRLQPNIDSESILNPPIGSTFEVEKKIGEWFEIKFSSEIGVLITGYIHSMFVEVVEEQPEPEREVIPEPVKPRAKPRPVRARPPTTARMRFSIMGAGLMNINNAVLDYEYSWFYVARDEDFFVQDYLESGNGFGFGGGIGIFITPNIEITGSYLSYSKVPSYGELGIDVPNPWFYDSHAHADSGDFEPSVKKTIISGGINFHPLTSGPIDIYFGGGASYISATVDLAEDFWYIETLDFFLLSQTVDFDSIFLEETDVSTIGFFGRAGVNLKATNNVFLFGEGRYIYAKKELESPLYPPDLILDLDLGGIIVLAGIKLIF